jgi:ketose-bisphosphate aldolases
MIANLNDVLMPAKKGRYAIGLFNTFDIELARAVLNAAEEKGSPVIYGTAEVLLPYGTLEDIAPSLLAMAKAASVPVVLHLDHGLNKETCIKALELGFSSVMYDCSTDTYEENVCRVKEMADIAHSYGASIEGELGHVGDNDSSAEAAEDTDRSSFFTDPALAKDYVEQTGVDALAISVGNAHGTYRFPPKLDFARITEIADAVPSTPLVLHGGSGIPDQDFKKAIELGISKVNIFTDINLVGAKAAHDSYAAGNGLTEIMPAVSDAVRLETLKKISLFFDR